ncbi:MAG: hypothetical protein AABW80_05280 [Nanoarchaeota archaeon]
MKVKGLQDRDNYECSMAFKALRRGQLSERESGLLMKIIKNVELSKFFGENLRN